MTRPHKYGAVKVFDGESGLTFDSKAEFRRYGELLLLERAGLISKPLVHPVYPLRINGKKIGRVTLDFAYTEKGRAVAEDVKSRPTMTEAASLRLKVFEALYPEIELRIIGKVGRRKPAEYGRRALNATARAG